MKTKILFLLTIVFFISCDNDDNNNTQTLSGIYTETSPGKGRSQLNFINRDTVIRSEINNSTEDKFTYEIIGNVIKLTPIWNNTTTYETEIEIINNSKFKIENFYPSVGLNPTSYMTFEK